MKSEDLFEAHFSQLHGTDSQCWWANAIRIPVIIQLLEQMKSHFPGAGDQESLLVYVEVLMGRYTRAQWWIEFEKEPMNPPLVEYFWNELSWFLQQRQMQLFQKEEDVKLVIFDIDNCITNCPHIDGQVRHILPGRSEVIHSLMKEGKKVAFVTNRGEVAFKMLSERGVWDEVSQVVLEITPSGLDIPFYTVCFAYPKPDYLRPDHTFDITYSTPEMLYRRMPNPGMLQEAIKFYHVWPHEVDVVGQNWENIEAARMAHVRTFYDTSTYFGEKILPPPPTQCEKIFGW